MKRNLIYLIPGLILTILGLVHLNYIDRNNNARYQNIIQRSFDKTVHVLSEEQAAIEQQVKLNKKGGFKDFKVITQYPYYIFKNDSLIYWSDNKFVIAYEDLQGGDGPYLLKSDRDIYLAQNNNFESDGDQYIVASSVNLLKYGDFEDEILQQDYNFQIFQFLAQDIYTIQLPDSNAISITGPSGDNLFWVKPFKKTRNLNKIISLPSTLLLLLGITLLMFFSVRSYKRYLDKRNQFMAGTCFSFIVLLLVFSFRVFYLPWRLIPTNILPSYLVGPGGLGDRMIFMFSGLIILLIISIRLQEVTPDQIREKVGRRIRSFLSILIVVVTIFTTLRVHYLVLRLGGDSLYISPYSIRYYMLIFNLPVYLYFIFLFSVFFLAFHFSGYYFIVFNPNLKQGVSHWIYATILSLMLAYYFEYNLYIVLGGSLFFFLIYYFKLPESYYKLGPRVYIYLISGAILYTFILFRANTILEVAHNQQDLSRIAKNLKEQRDFKGEILLSQLNNVLKDNNALKKAFNQEVFSYETIKYIVQDSLLNNYFDGYYVDVYAFDHLGQSIGHSPATSLSEIYHKYIENGLKTECKYLTLSNLKDGNNIYILVNEIGLNDGNNGTVVLSLKYDLSMLTSHAIDYVTLVHEKLPDLNKYSYVILSPEKFVHLKNGDFNYDTNFISYLNTESHDDFFSYGKNYHHYIRDVQGNFIIVSTPENYFKNLISKFSNLYLLSIFGALILFILSTLLRGVNKQNLNFSSQIRGYTNVAFLIPLTIIVLVASAVVTESMRDNQDEALHINSSNIANTIDMNFQSFQNGYISEGVLFDRIYENFNSPEVEINIFDKDGKVMFTTRPSYYEYNQRSGYVNPEVILGMETAVDKGLILKEDIAHLDFKTVYYEGKGLNNESYGYVGISYPKAILMLEQQTKKVITSILITFFILFIILMIASFMVSSRLTRPLSLIANKLNRTRLEGINEKIEWKGGGEIGLLSNEYNQMIEKLEKSKQELYHSQKQTAWKEMAKQVAHEIKNPLTPMKLSIQQLQRTLKIEDMENKERVSKVLSSINEQIDTISEIANSFSEFAKMPAPNSEPFEMVEIVHKATNLYAQNARFTISFDSDADEIWVMGDKLVLNRAVTNIILNAIQSMAEIEKPEISVKVLDKGSKGHIEVSDNGAGIPEENKKRVFVPNFTTKPGGSGLGLAMAKRGIEHSGGNLWFESEEGKGSTFYIDLLKTEKP